MKRYLLKFSAVILAMGMLTSCEEETVVFDVDNGQALAGFNLTAADIGVIDPAEVTTPSQFEVEVGLSTRANHDRVVMVEINEELTDALPSQYTIEPGPYVIPAGEFTTMITVTGNYNELPETEERTLTLDLISIEGQDILDEGRDRIMLTIYRVCPRDIPQNYIGFVTGEVGGATAEFNVQLVSTGDVATYEVTNLWGNFVAGATGDPQYNGQYPYPARLMIKCDNTVEVTGNPSGSSNFDYATGGTGTFDPSTNEFQLYLSQDLFSGTFTADIYLIPVP